MSDGSDDEPVNVALDAVDDHFQRNEVFAALGDNEICVFLAGLHELLMHGLDRGEILLDDRIDGASALFHIPADAAAEPHRRQRRS